MDQLINPGPGGGPPAQKDIRPEIVKVGMWGVLNSRRFTYTEGGLRMRNVKHRPLIGHIFCDCSAWVTYCYSWAGGKDPNGLRFDGQGYTGTLLSNGEKITAKQAQAGDVVVFGSSPGVHCALLLTKGPNPWTSSMGEQGQPAKVRVSDMLFLGKATYLRFSTVAR